MDYTVPLFIYMDVMVENCSCICDTSAIHGGRMPWLHGFVHGSTYVARGEESVATAQER